VSAQELRRQADLARRARFEADSGTVQDLNLGLRILARELYGREGRDLEVAVQAIDRMTSALATLRGQLEAQRDPEAEAVRPCNACMVPATCSEFGGRCTLEQGTARLAGTSLARLFGMGPVIAAAVIGDVRHVSRFPDRDHFAAYNGTAPIEVSSGGRKVYRLSRRGNRRLNHAIHMVAITQIPTGTPRAAPTTTRNWPRARPAKKRCAR
jgi:transposase